MDRNILLAIVLSLGIIIAWDLFVTGPQTRAYREAQREAAAAREVETARAADSFGPVIGAGPASATASVEDAIAASTQRVEIDTPRLVGSINLVGGRIDDLRMRDYRETLGDESPLIRLLSPVNTEHAHYIQQGWSIGAAGVKLDEWTAPAGSRLTPETPVTLTRRENGLVFEMRYSIDEDYMFTVDQTVRNESGEPATATPYAAVIQRNIPEDFTNFMILHEGPIAVIGSSLYERKYKKKFNARVEHSGERGWVGITNKYWLAAAIPPQGETFTAMIQNISQDASPVFQSAYTLAQRTIAPGETVALTTHLYGGAKEVNTLRRYEKPVDKGGLGVWDFDRAVDWGNFWFLTRPIFATLNYFGDLTGNFGVAILILTLIIKALLFPLANRAYDMTAKMKRIQPEMEKLKARYGDDKMKFQQEMMALYKKEKLNPVAGCVPILLQMPIFYALYKTLFVTLELRHEPFMLWIKDLSAPDPTTIFNLFGLIPYDPMAIPVIGAFLGIGVLPILMGVGMWFQLKLNPPPTDPVQAQIFALMPFIFVFLFASFASGLVLYWFWNTVLSVAQQWVIMKRNGVSVDWATNFNLKRLKKDPAPGGK